MEIGDISELTYDEQVLAWMALGLKKKEAEAKARGAAPTTSAKVEAKEEPPAKPHLYDEVWRKVPNPISHGEWKIMGEPDDTVFQPNGRLIALVVNEDDADEILESRHRYQAGESAIRKLVTATEWISSMKSQGYSAVRIADLMRILEEES